MGMLWGCYGDVMGMLWGCYGENPPQHANTIPPCKHTACQPKPITRHHAPFKRHSPHAAPPFSTPTRPITISRQFANKSPFN